MAHATAKVLVAALIAICIQYPNSAMASPQIKIAIKLNDGKKVAFKGTRAQLFKKMQKQFKIRENLEEQIEDLRDCALIECNGSIEGDKNEEIAKLESDVEDITETISEITNSLYGPKADVAPDKPLTVKELKFFISEIEYRIGLLNIELETLNAGTNPALVEFLADFDNSYIARGNYSKEMAIDTFRNSLVSYINSLKKSIMGLRNVIADGNSEGITEMRMTEPPTLASIIRSMNENIKENANL